VNGYIDMHCDTLMEGMRQHTGSVTKLKDTQLDIERLKQSGVSAQFFAMYIPQREECEEYGLEHWISMDELVQRMQAVFTRTLEENSDSLRFAGNWTDLRNNEKDGLISAFLTMENGAPVDGDLHKLDTFYDMGVRLITLTWNDPNCFGFPNSEDPVTMNRGLTSFGREAVEYMNAKGILIDVSHLSDGGFRDVAQLSKKPFVASHSNCRALSPHTRNLTDDMIRRLGDCGGVAGLNLYGGFLNPDILDDASRVDRLVDHAEHLIRFGGEECVGIGTDFDGITGTQEINECRKMHLLLEAMDRRGFSDDRIERIWYGNVSRVLRDVL